MGACFLSGGMQLQYRHRSVDHTRLLNKGPGRGGWNWGSDQPRPPAKLWPTVINYFQKPPQFAIIISTYNALSGG
ncbi:hypothetical protein J6590_063042 [Homalodisca vitripennis]|nr:hypothetical protein J6590_063042 [Homalodisca vitripennis]